MGKNYLQNTLAEENTLSCPGRALLYKKTSWLSNHQAEGRWMEIYANGALFATRWSSQRIPHSMVALTILAMRAMAQEVKTDFSTESSNNIAKQLKRVEYSSQLKGEY